MRIRNPVYKSTKILTNILVGEESRIRIRIQIRNPLYGSKDPGPYQNEYETLGINI
jgi:hypothetical protein